MRTAIEIPDDLLELARQSAARVGIAVDEVIAQALRVALATTPRAGGKRTAFPLHHSQSKGTLTAGDVRAAMDATDIEEDAARARPL